MDQDKQKEETHGTSSQFPDMGYRYITRGVEFFQQCSFAQKANVVLVILLLPVVTSLRYWVILLYLTGIGYLLYMLSLKAIRARKSSRKLLHAFFISFVLSCVWNYMSLYEEEQAKIFARLTQWNWRPPRDCHYHNMWPWEKTWYFVRVDLLGKNDRCAMYFRDTRADPIWRVNPLQAISLSVAMIFFSPLPYIGYQIGSFFTSFIGSGSMLMTFVLLSLAIFFVMRLLGWNLRISTSLFSIETFREVFRGNGENGNQIPGDNNNGLFPMLMAGVNWMLR